MGFNEDFLPLLVGLWELFKAIIFFPFPKTRKSLNGEVVLITGAGSGLGAGVAKLLARKGCILVCWDLNEDGNGKFGFNVLRHLTLEYPIHNPYIIFESFIRPNPQSGSSGSIRVQIAKI